MTYEPLSKIYYKTPAIYAETYRKRFDSPTTKHFNFQIREHNHQTEYPAFLCYTEELALLMEATYRKHERLLKLIDWVPPLVLRQFILSCAVEEIRATSDIEGIHSTTREIKAVIVGSAESTRFSSLAKKYVALLERQEINFQTCEDIRAFYDEFAHQEVSADDPSHKLDGKLFRADSVEITSASGKIIHRGAYPEEKIIELMSVALNVLNDEKVPLLIRATVFHYFFEYIHPFYDGNGRTARFIVSYFLSEHFHVLVALCLSICIKKQKKKYYALFRETDSEINCGDLTPFVTGVIEIISGTFEYIIAALDHKTEQLVKYKEKLSRLVSTDKLTQKLYEILLYSSVFFGRGLSMEELMEQLGKSRNTIKSRLDSAPAGHIIKSDTKKIFYKLNMMILKG